MEETKEAKMFPEICCKMRRIHGDGLMMMNQLLGEMVHFIRILSHLLRNPPG